MYQPLRRLLASPLTSKNQFSAGHLAQPHLHLPRSLPKLSTGRNKLGQRRLRVSSVPVRKKAMKRRLRWKKKAMCRWTLHLMRTRRASQVEALLCLIGLQRKMLFPSLARLFWTVTKGAFKVVICYCLQEAHVEHAG